MEKSPMGQKLFAFFSLRNKGIALSLYSVALHISSWAYL